MTRSTTILTTGTALIAAFAVSCGLSPVPFFDPDEDTGDEDTGDEDTGGEDTGDEDTGDEDTGDEDTGDEDTGDEDTGGDDTEEEEECDPDYDLPVFAEPDGSDPGLKTAAGCDEVVDLLRQKLQDQMVASVESSRAYILAQKAKMPEECWDYSDTDTDCDTDTDGDSDGDTDGDSDGAEDYSTTNNQVAGVDEPDFIKNDGNYIYVLADGRFQVLDAWPASEAHRISATEIEGEPKSMFVLENRAVVYSSLDPVWTGDPSYDSVGYYGGECTYGWDCELMGDGLPLKITVLDITDLAAPTPVREVELSGSLLAGRSIDGTTYTMVVFPEMEASSLLYGMQYYPSALSPHWYDCGSEIPFSRCEIQQMFDDLIEQNAEEIAALDPSVVLPSATDRRLVDGEWVEATELFADCSSFYLGESGDGMNQLSLLTFDPSVDEDLALVSIVDRPGAVYANATSLYMASRHYAGYSDGWYFDDPSATPEATTVHKFALDPAAMTAEYVGSGAVKGRVLNQFSMDEHEGYLRIATTTSHAPDANAHSTVSVLGESEGALVTEGQVDHIAPSEDIRSVRFSGDQGFIVTFKKTDPLFVLDLSDVEGPAIVGELEIPGFSTYMHLMDADHLLTIGYDADDMGGFAWFQGVMLQIFDISDPASPLLDHNVVIGTRGSTSEATTNHLAFNYFASRDLLALPMTICEGGDGGSYGYEMTFSGLLVYDVTAEDGFTALGGVPHAEPTSGDDYDTACGNWWTDSNSAVKRSVFMEDFVFSVAPDRINVASVSALGDVLVSLDLTAP